MCKGPARLKDNEKVQEAEERKRDIVFLACWKAFGSCSKCEWEPLHGSRFEQMINTIGLSHSCIPSNQPSI